MSEAAAKNTSNNLRNSDAGPPQICFNLPSRKEVTTTSKQPDLPIDVLLVTVRDCEFLACYRELKHPVRYYYKELGYVYFNDVFQSQQEKVKVALTQCTEGSVGPNSSLIAVTNAVRILRPKAVISVGACSGLNPNKTKLGDVVVSAKLSTYASKVVTSDQDQSASIRSYVSKLFLKLIPNCANGWYAPLMNPENFEIKVHCDGEFLSGPEKIKAERRRKELADLYPLAAAVEMEGEGVFTAAFETQLEWLIVKGIADYADGEQRNADNWKAFASALAASLVSHILHDPLVFVDWPHFPDSSTKTRNQPETPAAEAKKQIPVLSAESKNQPETSATEAKKQIAGPLWKSASLLNRLPWYRDSVCRRECQKQLRSIYETRNKVKIKPWDQSSAVHIDEIYTDLSWVMDHRTPRGVTQKNLHHYTDIFAHSKSHPAPKRILVYGQPGIGKTVFTQKTTFDWSQKKFPKTLGRFDLVLLVRLRDVCPFQDVPSILGASEVLAKDGTMSVDNLYDYVLRHQEKVLLILDGFDEYVYSTENQSPVFEIWEKKQLRDCCVIMTSREIGTDKLRNCSDAEFMIFGFNYQRQKEFARRFLEDDKNVKEFFNYLQQHDLRKLAQIPLLLLMLCLLWMGKDHSALPQKRAHIFHQFVETLFDHMHEKQSGGSVFMKKDHTAELYALGRLAFEALLQDCLYFPISKLPMPELIERLIEVGLFQVLNVESSLKPEKGMYFIHKSVQEYLAANFLKEELVSKRTESKNLLSQLDPIKTIRKLFEVFKFTCDLSEEAAREIMVQLGMAAKKEGLTEYSFDSETLTERDLSEEQQDFIKLCKQLFFYCSAETKRNLFPTFLSSLGGVLLIDSDELNVVVNEELVKTTEATKYIFFNEHNVFKDNTKYTEKDYLNLITLTQQLNAVIVSCSGEMKASEFLSNFTWRHIDEFFLKKEKTTYLYFCRIVKFEHNGIDVPHKMIKELINYPESRKKTKINPGGESSEQVCSTHALSRLWRIRADDVNRSEVELLSDVLPFLLAPQEIEIRGEYGEEWDSNMAKKILSDINRTHGLKRLTLQRLNIQSSAAGFIARLMKQSPNLERLDLSHNPLLGEGVDAIVQHLGSTPHLRSLLLYGVKMTAKQVQHLREAAMKHSSITLLWTGYHEWEGNILAEHN